MGRGWPVPLESLRRNEWMRAGHAGTTQEEREALSDRLKSHTQ
ncbi:predicted protein [Plenodomus lingam JN3]|uniref:Uncharacterized protein n=1 Tax=Leptosphaeria maculans (strain JN3 / isolate v23.1.3 / race Av1-4-5-6-7-8) TaxID=985895 RepID=E4ZGX5_LEPMJ|nr:predicted protein [Plenodomus lingam JN3]CBX90545.1 predicted protein [Plenodomus lingam JN3]